MPKQIKVPDDIYDRLKAAADAEYRSLGGQIEYLLDKSMGVSNVLGQKIAFTETTPSPKKPEAINLRGKGTILQEIRDLEANRDEELAICQDREIAEGIRRRYADQIQPLWNEFNLLKEA